MFSAEKLNLTSVGVYSDSTILLLIYGDDTTTNFVKISESFVTIIFFPKYSRSVFQAKDVVVSESVVGGAQTSAVTIVNPLSKISRWNIENVRCDSFLFHASNSGIVPVKYPKIDLN